jgi:hypothetical protein
VKGKGKGEREKVLFYCLLTVGLTHQKSALFSIYQKPRNSWQAVQSSAFLMQSLQVGKPFQHLLFVGNQQDRNASPTRCIALSVFICGCF